VFTSRVRLAFGRVGANYPHDVVHDQVGEQDMHRWGCIRVPFTAGGGHWRQDNPARAGLSVSTTMIREELAEARMPGLRPRTAR